MEREIHMERAARKIANGPTKHLNSGCVPSQRGFHSCKRCLWVFKISVGCRHNLNIGAQFIENNKNLILRIILKLTIYFCYLLLCIRQMSVNLVVEIRISKFSQFINFFIRKHSSFFRKVIKRDISKFYIAQKQLN